MAEPEELIIEGAHAATRLARAAWRRYGPAASVSAVPLAAVRSRLELFASALFQRPLTIVPMQPAAPVTWLARIAGVRQDDKRDAQLLSGSDGERVYLPPAMPLRVEGLDAIAIYQMLAVQQTARLSRGTPRVAATLATGARKWFLLAEAALVDCWIALELPGFLPLLSTLRTAALARRASDRGEQDPLERRLRQLLESDAIAPDLDLAAHASCEDVRRWALSAASRAAQRRGRRQFQPPWYWGRVLDLSPAARVPDWMRDGEMDDRAGRRPARVAEMRRRPRARQAADDEDDQGAGTWVIRADEPQESVEDPYGLQRPADHDQHADADGLADSLSDLPEARVVRTPGQAREVLRGGEDTPRAEKSAKAPPQRRGISYPEWDYRTGQYKEPGAIVREPDSPLGDAAWAASARARHGRLTRRVRTRFERLRPRHVRLGRQPDGSELDIDAFVTTAADIRARASVDGRLYVARRPARRELSVALLVDASASTDSWISHDRRIIDIEKEALLVVREALDALGDRYGIFAFSGEGPEEVSMTSLKALHEHDNPAIARRIAALDADRYTRMGAAIRHVTASLSRERTEQRLLLILSDGKPNDVDLYEGRYGVEDTRQAIAEARLQGVTVFCLTVDREAPRYAVRVFGRTGFAVLRSAEQLPAVLVDVLRHLLRT